MLDEFVVEEFLTDELADAGIDVPKDINLSDLTKAFCEYTKNDYYEWLRDNFKCFFRHCNPDWDWIREKIRECKQP
jgi:hypothetical protein